VIKPLFFNIQKLEEVTKCNADLMLLHLNIWRSKIIPKSAPKGTKQVNLAGSSYLLNFDDLLHHVGDTLWKGQYIRLAARRDYMLYKMYRAKYLDLSYFPDIDINAIKHNPLLEIVGNKLYFKFEENNGNLFQAN